VRHIYIEMNQMMNQYETNKQNLLQDIKWLGKDGLNFKYFHDMYKKEHAILHGLLADYLVEYKWGDYMYKIEDYEKLDFVLKILEQKKPRNKNKETVMKYIINGFEL
jgi:hypothetical protein